jgi:transcriptional regulator with XRE-family HTH domain
MRAIRRALDLTQAEVCDALGMSQGCYSKYELGVSNHMDVRHLADIADLYGVTIDQLLR